ncbi:MAG: DNA polymerase III subunit delta [Clostridia bacterium]|nr:DNA polymerase III subunit delta [Clostridia bacterium]
MEIKDLDKQIQSGTLANLYFFYGEEQFLLENKVRSIKKALLSPDFADLNFVQLDDKKLSVTQLSDELVSVPVMSDKKMVIVKNSGVFGNAKLSQYKTICELISDIPEYLCVIFCEKEFDKKKEKNLEPFKKYGEIVRFDPLSPVQLERWLDKLFSDKGKSILPRDIGTMIKLSGQSMATLFNEHQKLLNFVGDRTKITAEDVTAVVSKSADARIFDVIDHIASGKSQGAFDELFALRASGENPSTILSLLSSRIGELLMVKQLSYDKLSSDRIASFFEPRRPTFVVNKLLDQAKNFDEKYLSDMTILGAQYTADVRSGKLDKWIAVEMYAAKLLEK